MSIIISGVGRVGRDAQNRSTQGGDAVVGFSLAMDNGFGDKKQTLWFDCSGWGKRYTGVCGYLVKGAQVFVSGELGEREHDGKRYLTMRLNDIALIGGKPSGERQERTDGGGETAQSAGDDFGFDKYPF